MGQTVTLGGQRLGSGNKQTVELHNYEMTSFNLSQDFKSSMAPGVLYPFMRALATNHGTFDIDLDAFVRTLPTKGPLLGSFKLQADIFAIPFRLYQGILHNNPIKVGMNMDKIFLPKVRLCATDGGDTQIPLGADEDTCQVSENALIKYDGISGLGHTAQQQTKNTIYRKFQCIPELAYYDIFKNYYANKQEQYAYVITPGETAEDSVTPGAVLYNPNNGTSEGGIIIPYNETTIPINTETIGEVYYITIAYVTNNKSLTDKIKEKITDGQTITFDNNTAIPAETITLKIDNLTETYNCTIEWKLNEAPAESGDTRRTIELTIGIPKDSLIEGGILTEGTVNQFTVDKTTINLGQLINEIALQQFDLENIDDMRNALLSANTLNKEFVIGNLQNDDWGATSGTDQTGLPYSALIGMTTEGVPYNAFTMNGLCVKTYQSDLFNNWLDTEYIDGESGISAISSVAVVNNKFSMDSLNLAEKIYDYLNRVLVAGGTYEDWQEATYGEGAVRKAETPMYVGGMSSEIMFEEVIANTAQGNDQKLGDLGGRGTHTGTKGGTNIHIKCDEPSYIIGIVSITPRICYCQGNDWDRTELDTMDDLHKPALDGIGFQDLMVEQMAWWDTVIAPGTSGNIVHRSSAGKQIAWINYQTAVDKCYGDFAKGTDGYSYMVLSRHYEHGNTVFTVNDITTYIDPVKYNYAFAYNKLDAQNFWVQIATKMVARRKMAGKQIPNL